MATYSIDVVCPRNRDLHFAVTGEKLRSEIRLNQITGRSNGRLQSVGGVIPGMRIEVDAKDKVARIIDRMHLPENEELFERIQNVPDEENFPGSNTFTHFSREPVREFHLGEDAPHNEATWLFWMRRYIERERARKTSNSATLPSMDEIRKKGTIWIGDNGGFFESNKDGRNKVSYLYPPEPVGAKS